MRSGIAGFILLALAPAYAAGQDAPAPPNGAGRWSFGYGVTGGSFTPYPSIFPNDGGVAGWTVRSINGDIPYTSRYVGKKRGYIDALLLPGWVIMSPGPVAGVTVDSIVRWTALTPGTYQFSGHYEILSTMQMGVPLGVQALIFDNAADVTKTAFGGNSGALTGPAANLTTLKPGGSEAFSIQLTVVKGEVVSFGLNSAGSYYNDVTGLRVSVVPVGGVGVPQGGLPE